MTNRLRAKIFKSYAGSNIQKISLNIINFISKLILAKILLPEVFGLFASALSIIYILQQLSTAGLTDNLIRERKELLGNGCLLQLIIALIIIIIIQFSAGYFTYINPDLPRVLRIFIIVLIPHIFETQATIFFNKELLLQKTVLPSIIANLTNLVVAISLAFAGYDIWALVSGIILSKFVHSIMLWKLLNKHIKLIYTLKYSKMLFSGSILLFIIGLLGMISNNYNNLILNTMLNSREVGFYSMAVSFCSLLVFFESTSHSIVYPAFVKLREYPEKTALFYKYATLCISLTEVCIFLSLINNADWLIPLLLNPQKWQPVIPILKWLAISCIINPFNIYSISLLQAHKKDKFLILWSIALFILKILLTYFMLKYFQTTIAIVWSKIIETIIGIGTVFFIAKIIGYKNIFFKEYLYHICLLIAFSALYFSTTIPIIRFSGSILIVAVTLVFFIFHTLKKIQKQIIIH